MPRSYAYLLTVVIAVLVVSKSAANAQGDSTFGYSLELDVVYGKGKIAPQGTEVMRDLKMDVYTPTSAGAGPWPAVVYVHGGAFHRGGRMNPPYKMNGAIHSSPEDWARLLAASGFKVFVIEYRLAPEQPVTGFVPGREGTITDIRTIISEEMMAGFSRARTGLGLPSLGYDDDALNLIWNSYMAGVEDAVLAIEYIAENASVLNVDPRQIAMGGHSAGGGITASVGLGLETPLKAIFPMSPPDILFDKSYVSGRNDLPAVLVHFSQYDDGPVLIKVPEFIGMLREADTEVSLGWIPGFPHFYPYNATSLADDGTRIALGDRVIAFLDGQLKN